MSRNPFSNLFRSAFSEVVISDPACEKMYEAWKKSRRQFIRDIGLAVGSAALLPSFTAHGKTSPDIVIVGGGMAGLNAAYQFNKKGIRANVYEASSRTGGRMFTLSGQFGDGITTDIGGEFVDTSHLDIIALMKEFNLEFYDLRQDPLAPKTFYFDGMPMTQGDLRTAIAPYVKKIMKDVLSLPPLIDHTTSASFKHLDDMTITDYLISIGIKGWLYKFLNVVLTREYGMEASEQSAVNFLIMFVPPLDSDKDYELFGPAHEVFKIKGGSQHLTDTIYATLKDQVNLNHKLTKLRKLDSGKYELTFSQQNSEKLVMADFVLMTIPFSILRNISFSVPMPTEKRKCIDEIGYGNSCKFVIGVNQKPWRTAQDQGYTFTDLVLGAGWDSSQMQNPYQGSFTVFGGGKQADYINETKETALVEKFSSELNIIYPALENILTGKNMKFCWAPYPFTRGGYSSFKKGQWSTLSGWESTPVGNIFFAGEHVSKEFQGYMNGAAETSRVAVELMTSKISAFSN
jgi:monoamine oxidase